MAVITVARQIGSWGDRIAENVARVLGYEYVDKRLVEEIAAITDTTPDEVETYDEKGEGRVQYFLRRLLVPEISPGSFPLSAAAYASELGLEFAYVSEADAGEPTYLDRGTYQLLITTLVQDFGQTGKSVIVGRASQIILKDHPEACHIKVVAPLELRCARLQQSRGLDEADARKLVEQHDQWRHDYLRNYHHANWDDPLLYDLTINTGRVQPDEAVALIADYARGKGAS
jgi:cytidylate kinase